MRSNRCPSGGWHTARLRRDSSRCRRVRGAPQSYGRHTTDTQRRHMCVRSILDSLTLPLSKKRFNIWTFEIDLPVSLQWFPFIDFPFFRSIDSLLKTFEILELPRSDLPVITWVTIGLALNSLRLLLSFETFFLFENCKLNFQNSHFNEINLRH